MDKFLVKSDEQRPRTPLSDISNSQTMFDNERPAKRIKVDPTHEAENGITLRQSQEDNKRIAEPVTPRKSHPRRTKPVEIADSQDEASDDENKTQSPRKTRDTALESVLPEIATDKDAIAEYELMRASQGDVAAQDDKAEVKQETASSRIDERKWVRGKSSIYVDAFNLALDTVLEDEAHLFDEAEWTVFRQWRALHYEAQYLYVRLFLRKAAAWHRTEKLGYYSDISDPEMAISELQKSRELPIQSKLEQSEVDDGVVAGLPLQDWSLGGSFTFADASEECITSVEEASRLLSLDELKGLAKAMKVDGKNKADILKKLCRTSSRQAGLLSMGLRRESTTGSMDSGMDRTEDDDGTPGPEETRRESNRNYHLLGKIMVILGPCIRISPAVFKLFERVHLVFYRSTEWTEKSLTTIILAKISRRNFPQYIVDRSTNIFCSRRGLLEFEQAMRLEFEVDTILEFGGPPGEKGFRRTLELFEGIAPRWRAVLEEERRKEAGDAYGFNEGSYLRRFNAAHAYTRIAHKAAYVHGRLHEHLKEHTLLTEMLDQRLFHLARRGQWYQRKALLEEHYMHELRPDPRHKDKEQQKKHWRRVAVTTCETALEDKDCHLIYHYDLQKRLVKLEKQLKIPKRLQHEFAHVKLNKPEEHTVNGVQVKKHDDRTAGKLGGTSTKTTWVDEHEPTSSSPDATGDGGGGGNCSVEEMCLSHYRSQGWKGYHSEGGIVRTLFAYLFYDILFLYVPNVFQTAYQTCPLDLHTDAFYPARASEINHRLVEIANGAAERIIRAVDEQHRERKTCVVGLKWDFDVEDICELARCFGGEALAVVCKVQAQEFKQRGGGVPDLVLWRTTRPSRENDDGGDDDDDDDDGGGGVEDNVAGDDFEGEMMFAEVKSANDRLSDTQRLWIHVLTGAGVRVALVNAVAKEVRWID